MRRFAIVVLMLAGCADDSRPGAIPECVSGVVECARGFAVRCEEGGNPRCSMLGVPGCDGRRPPVCVESPIPAPEGERNGGADCEYAVPFTPELAETACVGELGEPREDCYIDDGVCFPVTAVETTGGTWAPATGRTACEAAEYIETQVLPDGWECRDPVTCDCGPSCVRWFALPSFNATLFVSGEECAR